MWNKILYLDICAAPVYLIIWFATVYRRMTRGRSNTLYLALTAVAFITVLSELIAGFCMYSFPLSPIRLFLVNFFEYIYFIFRNATNTLYVFFIFAVTETWYRLRSIRIKVFLALPFIGILILLLFNNKYWTVFSVTAEGGYSRGSAIIPVYLLASFYLVFGTSYLIAMRRTLDPAIWTALFSMYALNLIGVIIQYRYPQVLVECYFTSMTVLFIVFFVQRPERLVDMTTGLPGYRAFCEELQKLSITGQNVQLGIIQMVNALEMRRYLGEQTYFNLIYAIDSEIRIASRKEKLIFNLYFEQPGCFYYILENLNYNPVQLIPEVREKVRKNGEAIMEKGAQPDVRVVTVNFPSEISDPKELFRFGHVFARFTNPDKIFTRCNSIITQKEYQVETHIDDILNRTLAANSLNIMYQPVWSVKEKRFSSASVKIRIHDDFFGDINEKLLFSAAEERGVINKLGDYIMDQIFSFVGDSSFSDTGFKYVSITLSATQCMQMNLTDRIWNLRDNYKIHPENIEFNIRESVYENMSGVFNDNINTLSMQGYRITLDGYGMGYSDMRHILSMPLSSVCIDKRIISASSTEKGQAMLRGIIAMIKRIPLEVAAKGVDDKETANMLIDMGCELLEGCFYCDPLSQEEIINHKLPDPATV